MCQLLKTVAIGHWETLNGHGETVRLQSTPVSVKCQAILAHARTSRYVNHTKLCSDRFQIIGDRGRSWMTLLESWLMSLLLVVLLSCPKLLEKIDV
ncbi:MAG: hypothetical protein NHB32_14205 [Fischerella sp. CENA71]|nr:hypothetical protein [Fischerella sp. CENA71]